MNNEPAASNERLFFLHVPKTAGTSLRRYIEDQNHPKGVSSARAWGDVTITTLRDIREKTLIMGHFDSRILPFIPSDFIKAVFLRDPVSRTISAINHALRDKNFRPNGFNYEVKSIHELIRIPEAMAWFCNNQVALMSASYDSKRLLESLHLRSDLSGEEGLTDDSGISADLSIAKDNLERFDFIGLTERFDEYVIELASLCNYYPPLRSPRLNISPIKGGADLNKDEIRIIESYNELDLEFYEFAHSQALISKRRRQINRFFSGHNAITRSSSVDLSSPFQGYGFHEEEYLDDGSSYRWSGPELVSELTLKIGKGEWEVVVEYYIDASRYATSVDIKISQSTKSYDAEKNKGIYSKKFLLNIGSSVYEVVSIEFRTDKTDSPYAYGDEDLRSIGFMLTSVSLSKAAL